MSAGVTYGIRAKDAFEARSRSLADWFRMLGKREHSPDVLVYSNAAPAYDTVKHTGLSQRILYGHRR